MRRNLLAIFTLATVALATTPNFSAAQTPNLQQELSRLLGNQGGLESLPQLLQDFMGTLNRSQWNGYRYGRPIYSSRPYGAMFSDGSYRYFVGPGWPTPPVNFYPTIVQPWPLTVREEANSIRSVSHNAATTHQSQAVYTPVVAPESIAELSVSARQLYADQAIEQGINHFRKGDTEVAQRHFQDATVLTPQRAAAWGLCGIAATAAQAGADAEGCAKRVRELIASDPTERSAFYRRLAPLQGVARGNFEQLIRRPSTSGIATDVVAAP